MARMTGRWVDAGLAAVWVSALRPRPAAPISCTRLRRDKGERASPDHVNALRAPQAFTKAPPTAE